MQNVNVSQYSPQQLQNSGFSTPGHHHHHHAPSHGHHHGHHHSPYYPGPPAPNPHTHYHIPVPQVPAYEPFSFPQMFENNGDPDVTIGKAFPTSTVVNNICNINEPTFRAKTTDEYALSQLQDVTTALATATLAGEGK